MDFLEQYCVPDELYHHGIKGQKWGIRRWQNEDGTLTEAGRRKYLKMLDSETLNRKWDKYQETSKKLRSLQEDHNKKLKTPSASEERKEGIKVMDSMSDSWLKNTYGETYNRSDSKAKNKFYDRHFKDDFYDYYYDDVFGKTSDSKVEKQYAKENSRLNKQSDYAEKAFRKELKRTLKNGRSLLDKMDLNTKMGRLSMGSASAQKRLIDKFDETGTRELFKMYIEKRYLD